MNDPANRPRHWRFVAAIFVVLILVLSLWPSSALRPLLEMPGFHTGGAHFLGYAALAWLVSHGWPLQPLGRMWVAVCVLGLLVELAQIPVPGRGFQWSDVLVNAAGALLGASVALATRRKAWNGSRPS